MTIHTVTCPDCKADNWRLGPKDKATFCGTCGYSADKQAQARERKNLTADQRLFLAQHLTALQLAVVLARLDHHSWQRIANAMNLDEATIRGHHKRATRRLANATRTKEEAT